jgi:penicillin-insensitive murein endopeptidase
MGSRAVVCVAALALSACAQHGFGNDGGSVSYGPSRDGVIFEPVELPARGEGYWTPPRWEQRGNRYGTDELVSLVVYLGRHLERQAPGYKLAVADLSPRTGGRSRWHRSHQTGRDIDLIFLARNAAGNPVLAERMWQYDDEGRALAPSEGPVIAEGTAQPDVFFDEAANWTLVKGLIENPITEVQYIFVADWLKQRLLDYAEAAGESRATIQYAGYLLHQPSDSAVHDDHMHVRVFCSQRDLAFGCEDFGILRWHKKDYKYEGRPQRQSPIGEVSAGWTKPLEAAMAAGIVPFRGFVIAGPRG